MSFALQVKKEKFYVKDNSHFNDLEKWRHDMEMLSMFQALCEGDPLACNVEI